MPDKNFQAFSAEALGKPVSLGSVEKELVTLFASDEGISRASLINLAVYNESLESLERNNRILTDLTQDNACRTLLIASQAQGERSAQAWVQAHCTLSPGGEKAVCTEQVSFVLTGSNIALVRNALFANLDSDLPLVFWWQGELSDIFEERLYSRIDRLIVDSRQWADAAPQFLRLSQAINDESSRFATHDLAYTRSAPLRAAIRTSFDDPKARNLLPTLESATITFRKGHRTAALWLGAWLANRLGSKLKHGTKGTRFEFQRGSGQSFSVELQQIDNPVDDGTQDPAAVPAVEIHSPMGRVAIERTDGGAFWRQIVECENCEPLADLIPASPEDDASLVNKILRRAGRNRAIVDTMTLMREMLISEF